MHRTLAHQLTTMRHSDERAQADRERSIRHAGGLHHSESIEAARAAVAAFFTPLRPSGLSPA